MSTIDAMIIDIRKTRKKKKKKKRTYEKKNQQEDRIEKYFCNR
jgi:hypothetical protein